MSRDNLETTEDESGAGPWIISMAGRKNVCVGG